MNRNLTRTTTFGRMATNRRRNVARRRSAGGRGG